MSTAARVPSSVAGRARGRHQAKTMRVGGSLYWLALPAVLFVIVVLVREPLSMPLAWDESTYIAQTSVHSSLIMMPPNHSRGVALLAAPVTLMTTSVIAMRIWMTLLSGLGLFLALSCWRGIRSTRILALAGVILGSLAVTQLDGPLVMANLWEALGALALAGLFLQVMYERINRQVGLTLLAIVTFFLILVRFQDAVFILAPIVLGMALVRGWRDLGAAVAIGVGILAGVVEWVGEAIAFYHGPIQRWAAQSKLPPGIGFHFSLIDQLRVLDGPQLCVTGTCPGWDYPGLTAWWAEFLGLLLVGVLIARRRGISTRLCFAIGLSVVAAYGFLVPVLAARYLLPALALFCIPIADTLAWLPTQMNRSIAVVVGCAFVLCGAVTQAFVLRPEQQSEQIGPDLYALQAQQLRHFGVGPPCAVETGLGTPVAYDLGCMAGFGTFKDVRVLVPPPTPTDLGFWRVVHLKGLPHTAGEHGINVYLSCNQARLITVCP